MASEKRPIKGILKSSSSFDTGESSDGMPARKLSMPGCMPGTSPPRKEMKWDEMNILATYHPENKDYGHKKIDEPPTPYNRMTDAELDQSGDEREGATVDPSALASRLEQRDRPKVIDSPVEESSEEEDETPEERAKRKVFENRRKAHYNEYQAIKLARELMQRDEEEEDEEEGTDKKENNEDASGQ